MNIQQMKEALQPWMRNQSWNSTHYLDTERFHNALKAIFGNGGFNLDIENFQEAMNEAIEDLYPDYNEDFKDELVTKFALRAEDIGAYLYTTQ